MIPKNQQQRILDHIHSQVSTSGTLFMKAFKGGASNLTYSITDDHNEWILRTSPPGNKAQGAHNMRREFELLKRLHPVYPLCPEVVFFCDDADVFEREFYVMKPLHGLIIRKTLPECYPQDVRAALCQQLVQAHAQLHQADTHSLQHFNKGPGYIKRQINGWIHRYQRVAPEHDLAPPVFKWLIRHMPEDKHDYSLIHNDFKFDNVVFDHQAPLEIIGVLDWELTTIGDPWMDLGCSLAYWFEAGDNPHLTAMNLLPTHKRGMLTRDQVVEEYCRLTGQGMDDYRFYYIYGLFRLVVIIQQIYYRYERGQSENPAFAPFGHIRDLILQHTLRQLTHD